MRLFKPTFISTHFNVFFAFNYLVTARVIEAGRLFTTTIDQQAQHLAFHFLLFIVACRSKHSTRKRRNRQDFFPNLDDASHFSSRLRYHGMALTSFDTDSFPLHTKPSAGGTKLFFLSAKFFLRFFFVSELIKFTPIQLHFAESWIICLVYSSGEKKTSMPTNLPFALHVAISRGVIPKPLIAHLTSKIG